MDGSAAVDVNATTKEGGKKADRLRLDVDPKLLVASKSKGPPLHRQFPTHEQPKERKVCLHDAACAWRHSEVPDFFDSLTHSTESRFVSTASTGGGEGCRKTSSVYFAVLCTPDSVHAQALRYKVSLFLKFSKKFLINFLEISKKLLS
jgi:hypothetical protein